MNAWAKKVKLNNFDTRPRKPAWNTDIADASRLHAARRTALGTYEAAGRRAIPRVASLPQLTRLPPDEHPPPAAPTRFQSRADVDADRARWYSRVLAAYKAQFTDIRRERTQLMVDRSRAKTTAATKDWTANPNSKARPTPTRSAKTKAELRGPQFLLYIIGVRW